MTAADFTALSPLLALAATSVAVMLAAAFRRQHRLAAGLTLAGLAASGAALALAWPLAPRPIGALLIIDRFALFFIGLILAAAFAVAVFSYDYLERRSGGEPTVRREEYYVLLVLATLGCGVLAASAHFVSFFLGLELLSVSLFALLAYLRMNRLSLEAGAKYLILAGASAAFLLFGMSLIYADTGEMELARIASVAAAGGARGYLTLAGAALVIVGIGFKLSLVPFHLWAPDVYEGAPAPIAAFVATASKGAVFAVLLRVFTGSNGPVPESLSTAFTVLAIASMFAGNWLALMQKNVKRMLAYSSIAHMGYLLVALLASGAMAVAAVAYYLAAYFVTTLGAFGVVSILSAGERDADAPGDYSGLAWRRPWMAGVFSAMLLSLAGIPLTAGFVGKFYVLAAGVRSDLWLLVIALVINSAIGLFYYLRTMAVLFRRPAEAAPGPGETGPATPAEESLPWRSRTALLVLSVALVWLGVFPAPLIALIQTLSGV